jgi:hypothetical protein
VSDRVGAILAQVAALTSDERAELVARLLRRDDAGPSPTWGSACGIARSSLLGEDAQTWVTRHRVDADAARPNA